jgi:hypothetical protein
VTKKTIETDETPDTGTEQTVSFPAQDVSAPLADRFEYEQQIDRLPDRDRELAIEATRLADLSRYFSEANMQVPPHLCREIIQSRNLPVPERVETLQAINAELMEYLHSVSEDSELRM